MAEVHTYHSWEGQIGEILAQVYRFEVGIVMLRCPQKKKYCSKLQYKFPIPPGKTAPEALSDESLPSCEHGTMVFHLLDKMYILY